MKVVCLGKRTTQTQRDRNPPGVMVPAIKEDEGQELPPLDQPEAALEGGEVGEVEEPR